MAELESVLLRRGARRVRDVPALGLRVERLAAGSRTEEDLAAEIVATGAVEYAQPDYLVSPAVEPNDPDYDLQWQHARIGSPAAWDTTTGGTSVLVGVCDTGISSGHPDLAANLRLPGYNAVDGGTDTEPVYNHGTGVAGCIAAVGNNGTGVSGVAWSAAILPIRITNQADGRAYVSDAADGIRWAADQGAQVVNLSYRMAQYAAIDSAAQYLRDRGGLLFVAAGNDGQDPGWPDYDSFVAVAATTSGDAKASWSNYGTYIDVAAPGSSVYSTSGASGYGYLSGTSFASPIAAGVAALLYALDPNASATEVETWLFASCVDLGGLGEDDFFGHGRVDAAAAVALAANTTPNTPPVAVASATPTSGTAPLPVSFDGSGSTDADGSIVGWAWDFGDGATGGGASPSHTYDGAGTWTAVLTVTDDRGSTASDSVQIVVTQDPSKVVYVASIELVIVPAKGGDQPEATVTLVTLDGGTAAGGVVTGTWGGVVSGTTSATANADGVAVLLGGKTRKGGTVTLAIDDVVLSGYVFDPTLGTTSASTEKAKRGKKR